MPEEDVDVSATIDSILLCYRIACSYNRIEENESFIAILECDKLSNDLFRQTVLTPRPEVDEDSVNAIEGRVGDLIEALHGSIFCNHFLMAREFLFPNHEKTPEQIVKDCEARSTTEMESYTAFAKYIQNGEWANARSI